MSRRWIYVLALVGALLAVTGTVLVTRTRSADSPPAAASAVALGSVVPVPASVTPADGVVFTLAPGAEIRAPAEAGDVAEYLAGRLRPSTGYALPVRLTSDPAAGDGGIALVLAPDLPDEGYQLDIAADAVVLRAASAAGLFHGVQTLRQLFPPSVEQSSVHSGPWTLPGGRIADQPRFAYRGAMLDVARHFFGVPDVLAYVDLLAMYKINYLHLHLSDDQGWRIAIDGWPRLTAHGGSTQVGGGPGGSYTKEQYRQIVAYAQSRYVTVVPEIDMPGHTNAALASYAELNCDGQAPSLYTGMQVGFSALCPDKELTYDFVDDVLSELAALTPGPYLHIGGDEVEKELSDAEYAAFMNRIQRIVTSKGKTVMGWHQLAAAEPAPNRVLEYWAPRVQADDAFDTTFQAAVREGARVVMAPADHAYLDMKYTASSPLGLTWAGTVEVQAAYDWDPGKHLIGIDPKAVIGVEAPLWTETVRTLDDLEYLAFPRLPALAEVAWSPASSHDWTAFRERLGAQRPRWTELGINFYDSPQLP
jgi:hexosaminidase